MCAARQRDIVHARKRVLMCAARKRDIVHARKRELMCTARKRYIVHARVLMWCHRHGENEAMAMCREALDSQARHDRDRHGYSDDDSN